MTSGVTAESEADTNLPQDRSRGEQTGQQEACLGTGQKEVHLVPQCQYQQSIHAYSQLSPHQTPTVSKRTPCLPEQQFGTLGGKLQGGEEQGLGELKV